MEHPSPQRTEAPPAPGEREARSGAGAGPSPGAVLRARLVLLGFALRNLLYMNYASLIRPRLWWLRRTGREAQVEAIIERISREWAQHVFRSIGCRVEVEGAELVPREGPVVVMPNHQSLFDIPLVVGWLGRPVGFVFKRELLRIPGMRYWMFQINSHPVDRSEHREAAEQYDRWGEELQRSGRCLVLFPEGTRSRDPDGRIGPFRRGVIRLAGPRRIPVLPIVIDGTRFLVRPEELARTPPGERVVRMRILPPRVTEPMNAPEAKRFMEALREAIVSTRESIRVHWR